MGTINYRTSKYITLAIKPYDIADEDEYDIMYEADWDDALWALSEYKFKYFNLTLEPGYYEGISLYIDTDFDFWDDEEKEDALNEAKDINDILNELNGMGYHACGPGWVTRYYTYEETKEKIKEAMHEIIVDIKDVETYTDTQAA